MWIFIGDEYRGLFARWQSNFRAIWLRSVQQYQFSIHWWEWHYFIRHDMAFSQPHRYRLQRLLQITFHGKTRQMGTRPRLWRKDWRKGNVVILVPVYCNLICFSNQNSSYNEWYRVPDYEERIDAKAKALPSKPNSSAWYILRTTVFFKNGSYHGGQCFYSNFFACYGTIYLDFW